MKQIHKETQGQWKGMRFAFFDIQLGSKGPLKPLMLPEYQSTNVKGVQVESDLFEGMTFSECSCMKDVKAQLTPIQR